MTAMRTILALLALALTACDPCAAAMEYHAQQCAGGDAESCMWIQSHGGDVNSPTCG